MTPSYPKSEAPFELPPKSSSCLPTLHTVSDPDTLMALALEAILSLIDASSGSFFSWDEFQKELTLKATRGRYRMAQIAQPHVKLREGILGLAGEQGQPILVKDIHEDGRFKSIKRDGKYETGSFILLPLVINNKLIGVINITERDSLLPFTDEDLERAQQFAQLIAIAFEQLRSIQHVQKENEELHHRISMLSQISKEQESLASVGKLAANLTHELSNPLDAIRRYVNLALDQVLEDSLAREYLLKAKKGIRQAIHVIRGLLNYSREIHHASGSQTIEIHSLISESLDCLGQHPDFQQIKIRKQFEADTTYVTDRGLPLVLHNLYQNACHAMNGEGTLSISTIRNNGKITVAVSDTGCGIAEHSVEHIFEPFYTTKSHLGGTGIGLTLCREIILKCGGTITCKNNEARGASFLITLPCIENKS